MEGKKRVVYYVNQFFGQIGGEEKADIAPQKHDNPVGPAVGFNQLLGDAAEVVGTVICGDTYFNENLELASQEALKMIESFNPDLVVAGPAFNAGRYGMACGRVAQDVSEKLDIPVVTGMYPENPGAEMYKKFGYFVETTNSAAGMRTALPAMAKLATKLVKGEALGTPEEEGYMPRGIRVNLFTDKRGSERAIDMLLLKIKGEPFVTEYPMPAFDRVDPAAAIVDLKTAKIALVTSGGTVPHGNPDRIESSSASKYGKYDIDGVIDLVEGEYETAHGGYDPVYANRDSDRVLPVDVLRDLEKAGEIGELHRYFYTTVGNGTAVASAKKYAAEIAEELLADGVDAVILTST